MSVRDALLLNTTGSNFQALQSDDTARIKGDLSIQKDNSTEVLGIDVSQASVNVTGNITASVNISSSLSSTGSFGRVVATTFHGDGSALKSTLPRSAGILTSSAQIAAQISGAFTAGFEFSSSISGSATSTGSFGRVEGVEFFGDGSNIKSTIPRSTGLLTSSKQIASNISGSFNKGFEFTGTIKGSVATANGTWSTSGALISGHVYHGYAGSKTAGISAMGLTGPLALLNSTNTGNTIVTNNEEYNGSTWSEASDNNISRALPGAAGTVNDALFFGGYTGTPQWYGASKGDTETYNGTNFSEVNDMIIPRRTFQSAGLTGNAALAIGGYKDADYNPSGNPAATANMNCATEEYNGTNWSSVGQMTTSVRGGSGAGSVNSAVVFGTIDQRSQTYHYDGSSWSSGGSGHENRFNVGGGGTQNDAISFAGWNSPIATAGICTQTYDGSTWAASGNMNTAVRVWQHHQGNQGQAVNALAVGGSGTPNNAIAMTCTEEYTGGAAAVSGSFGRLEFTKISGDGTNLRSSLPYSPGLLSSSKQIASNISGSFNKGFNLGGSLTATEILTASYVGVSGSAFAYANNATTMSISSLCGSDFDYRLEDGIIGGKIKGSSYGMGVWSATTAMISATHGRAMAGTQNAFLSIGGYSDPTQTTTEKFNGSSWSVSAALISSARASAGVGTQNAAGMFGGYADYDQSEFYNGAAWSNGPNMGTTAAYRGSAGTQNAGLIYGGNGPGNAKRSTTELYNGNVFTETADLNTARGLAAAGGTQNDAIYAGGLGSPTGVTCTETWNGTSWTEVADMITMRWNMTGIGTANHHVAVTGHAGGAQCNSTEEWNGTSWSEVNDLISLRSYTGNAAGGLGSQGIYAGGYSHPGNAVVGTTELWNAGHSTTGSFGRLDGGKLFGDATTLTSSINYNGLITGSAQIASNISGSFNKGFTFNGKIDAPTAVWETTADMGTFRRELGANGNSQAAVFAGGRLDISPGTSTGLTETWDGSSWSEANDLTIARYGRMAGSSVNNGYFHGGWVGQGGHVEKWDGSSWSTFTIATPGTAPADGQQGFQSGGHLNGYIGGCAPDYLFFYNSYYGGGGYFTELNLSDGVTVRCPQIPLGDNAGVAGDIKTEIVAWGGSNTPRDSTHLWNGSSWSTAPAAIISAPGRCGWRNHMGAGASANAAVHIGGETGPPAGPAYNCQDNTSEKNAHQGWNGTTWTVKAEIPVPLVLPGATGTENDTFVGGGIYRTYPGNDNYCVSQSYSYQEDLTVGSFGRLEFISASGDATGLQNSLNYSTNPSFNILTGSSQIASRICGSFNKGFDFSGEIKAAPGGVFATSTVLPDNQSGAGGGSMLQGTAIVAGGLYGGGWPPVATDKVRVYDGSSWSEANDMVTGVRGNDTTGYAGDCNAGIFFGGCSDQPNPTEEWNGTNWTEVADIADGTTSGAAAGGESSEAAIWVTYFGGRTNKWDGTTWTEANDMNVGRYDAQGTGTRDAFMVIGGVTPSVPSPYIATCTEIYNGTNWTEVADTPYPTSQAYGMGQSNDAVFAGGVDYEVGGHQACDHSQVYDGTAWSMGPNINNKRRTDSAGSRYSGPAAAGASNAAWLGGGSPGYPTYNSTHTEIFPAFVVSGSFGRLEAGKILGDASGITSTLPYPAGIKSGSAQLASSISGSFTQGFILDGNISGSVTSTGSFGLVTADFIHGDGISISGSLTRSSGILSSSKQISSKISGSFNKGFGYDGTIQTAPGGVWSDSGAAAFPGGRTDRGAVIGIQKAFLQVGREPGSTTEAYEFNGSNWSSINDFNNGRKRSGGIGTVNEAVLFGGGISGGPYKSNHTETFNGTNWSEVNDMIQSQDHLAGAGSSYDAALAFGGVDWPSTTGKTEEWNGTNWTAVNDMINAGYKGGGTGESSEAAIASGDAAKNNYTETWNGTNWSAAAAMSAGRCYNILSGTTNDAIVYGGVSNDSTPVQSLVTEIWNGSSWSTGPNHSVMRNDAGTGTGGNVGASQGAAMIGSYASTATEYYDGNVSSASFHNIEVTNLTGDGTQFSASLQAQLLTGSSQIATYVSGSFNKGFTFEAGSTLSSDFYVGVSGSVSSSRGPESSSFFGSDYDPSIRCSKGKQTRTRGSSGAWKDVAPPVNICNQLLSGFGHKDGFLLAGDGAKVEEFDGTSWKVKNCMNFAHGYSAPGAYIRKAPAAGTVYAGLVTGGCLMSFGTPTNHAYKDTLIYNGSNWSEAGQQTVTHGREQGPTGHGMDGTQNAAILAGGRGPAVYACTEIFNGTNWSEVADQQEATYDGTTVGTTNAAHLVGGRNSSHSGHKKHQCWDGSAWSYRTNVPGHHKAGIGGGVAEDFMVSSYDHSVGAPGQIQRWDGTAWASVGGGYNTKRDNIAGDGTSVDLLLAGGRATPSMVNVNCTEVWEEESHATSSFGRLQTNVGGAIETDMFNMSGSTMKLPTFSDAQIDTQDISPQEGTSSIEPVVNVFEKPGAIWFHSDKNALAFTYVSSSVYSQSVDFVRCFYTSGSMSYTASTGFITQSHYCYHNVIQYITGSYT